jgi:hypothetical protein
MIEFTIQVKGESVNAMTDYLDFEQARYNLVHSVNQSLKEQFKLLLEEKHLYQSVDAVDFSQIYDTLSKMILMDRDKYDFQQFANGLHYEPITPSEQQLFIALPGSGNRKYPKLILLLLNVKLYCSNCKTRETFSPTWQVDATNEIIQRHSGEHRIALHPRSFQLFTFVYQCETCRSVPVSFLVARKGWKLTIAGRSPFEEVDVPKFIPKSERWLFSEAIVATQTGNTLAGLFYLRSFIEQFARRQTGIKGKQTGETILDKYQAMLPETQRDHMPSLRSWYEKLSAPIHAATPDDSLFQEARTAIEEHFDFRRLYKIPETATQPAGDGANISPAALDKK